MVELFSITGHGKSQVDSAGRLAKCSLCGFVGLGGKVFNVMDCKSYLIPKFGDKTNPAMLVKELKIEEFPDLHA